MHLLHQHSISFFYWLSEIQTSHIALLHSYLKRELLKWNFHIYSVGSSVNKIASTHLQYLDEEILSSITFHTTGKPEMSTLEKIVYIADYIEPMRYKASRLPEIRKLAFEDLDECMYEILKDTLEYLEEDSADDIEPTSKEAYIYYKELHNKRNNVSDN